MQCVVPSDFVGDKIDQDSLWIANDFLVADAKFRVVYTDNPDKWGTGKVRFFLSEAARFNNELAEKEKAEIAETDKTGKPHVVAHKTAPK